MITSSDSPLKGNVMPNQYLDVLLHTIRISGSGAIYATQGKFSH